MVMRGPSPLFALCQAVASTQEGGAAEVQELGDVFLSSNSFLISSLRTPQAHSETWPGRTAGLVGWEPEPRLMMNGRQPEFPQKLISSEKSWGSSFQIHVLSWVSSQHQKHVVKMYILAAGCELQELRTGFAHSRLQVWSSTLHRPLCYLV